jgi:nucleotide-binding universal stress UspA family protein
MYKFNKILVGLDNTSTDRDLIIAASDLCSISGSKEIFFVNVIHDVDLSDNLKKEFPNLIEHALEDRRKEIEKQVSEHFVQPSDSKIKLRINILVEQGAVTKTLLKTAQKEKVDLFVLGRKTHREVGILITRIARRATCSLLIIPKGKRADFKTIFVPTDFSDYSRKAMEKAIILARRSAGESKIIVQNVYQVPTGYHYTGKSVKEFAQIMKDNAQKECEYFLSSFNTKNLTVERIYSLDNNDNMTGVIVKEAKRHKADIIIFGAKGRTATAALFIGSKAEHLVQLNDDIPMLVIRPKGKGAGFLESIKEF